MSFFNLFRGSFSKSQSVQNRSLQSKPLKFEALEQREMLAITSILSEVYTDSVTKADEASAFYLDLTSDPTTKWVTVGLIVEAADGSALDPSQIVVKYLNSETEEYDTVVPNSSLLYQTDGTSKSTLILYVPGDTYLVEVGGDDGTIGNFTVDVYVPGGTEENPTSVEPYASFLVQTGLLQLSEYWNPSMEALYKYSLGSAYRRNIGAAYPELNVTETGQLNQTDAQILAAVAISGDVTAELSKTEPEDPDETDLTMSSASLTGISEKATAFGDGTEEITVTGGSATSLKDYTVVLSSTYTISGGSGADLSGVELPTLTSGTDYKFEDGKFYFNPNGNFDFIPKGTTATLTLTYTATDKEDTSLKGTGTITVEIVGANDTPEMDESDIDLTSVDIWSQQWSETVDGVNTVHDDEIELIIDGNEIKHGSTVIATIEDVDIGDTFEFATIGFPAGSVTLENSVWVLWTAEDDENGGKKAAGEIRLSEDKKTLYYKSAGDRDDSLFKDLENDEPSEKFSFTFTVKDNRGVSSNVTDGDQKSESIACSVSLQVQGMQDPQMGVTVLSTGTDIVMFRAQETIYDGADTPSVPLTSFFTVDFTGEKILSYSFVDMAIEAGGSLEISDTIADTIKNAFEISGSDKIDGQIRFNRNVISSSETKTFLNELEEGEFFDVTFKVKVKNAELDAEYMNSETLTIRFLKSIPLDIDSPQLSVSQHDDEWASSTQASKISGGVGQTSTQFYDIALVGDYTVEYSVGDGMVHEKPELIEGEDYKYEIVVINETLNEIGVNFYFNPNGKFDFLAVDQNAIVEFTLRLSDTVNQMLECTFTWEVTVRGEAESVIPEFKDDVELSTDENKALEIKATDLIENENSETSEWVVEQVYVKAEDVALVNGETPEPSTQVDGYYVISRLTDSELTITFNSGSVAKLVTSGLFTFDPTGRTDNLGPYDENDPETYADETLKLLVKDSKSLVPPTTLWMKEFTIRVKGIAESDVPEFKDVTLDTFQNNILTLTGADIATSTNSSAQLVIDQISLDFDEVRYVDDEEPDEEDDKDGIYIVNRPESGSIKITLTNGTNFSLSDEGVLTYNPTTRDDTLEPYEEGKSFSFSDTQLTFIVSDISEDPSVPTASAKGFNIRTKGVHYPEFLENPGNLTTPDTEVLTVKATDLAQSSKTDAQLVIDMISIDIDKIELVNGSPVEVGDDEIDQQIIIRSETDQTITLKSGTLYTLTTDGELKIDPTGRDPLPEYDPDDPDTYENETFLAIVADISIPTPALSDAETLTVRIQGTVIEEKDIPTFKDSVDLNIVEGNFMAITATTIAESAKEDAVLLIDQLAVPVENVKYVNDSTPVPGTDVDGYYVIQWSGTTNQSITLNSGIKVTLRREGEIRFDATELDNPLEPYDPDNDETYIDEKITLSVADTSETPNLTTATSKEFTIHVMGPATEEEEESENSEEENTSGDEADLLYMAYASAQMMSDLSQYEDATPWDTTQTDDDNILSMEFVQPEVDTLLSANTFSDTMSDDVFEYTTETQSESTLKTDDLELCALYDHVASLTATGENALVFDLDVLDDLEL